MILLVTYLDSKEKNKIILTIRACLSKSKKLVKISNWMIQWTPFKGRNNVIGLKYLPLLKQIIKRKANNYYFKFLKRQKRIRLPWSLCRIGLKILPAFLQEYFISNRTKDWNLRDHQATWVDEMSFAILSFLGSLN